MAFSDVHDFDQKRRFDNELRDNLEIKLNFPAEVMLGDFKTLL